MDGLSITNLIQKVEKREGITYAQAMDVFANYCERNQAAPTIAVKMGIPYKTVCDVLDGRLWTGARQYWVDRVMP